MNRKQIFASLLLLALCAALADALMEELEAAPQPGPVVTGARSKSDSAVQSSTRAVFKAPSLTQLSAITARPLFFEGRRLPVPTPEQKAAAKPLQDAKVVLYGVIITPDQRVALIQPASTGEVAHVSVGQMVEGWRIKEIMPDRIVLIQGDQIEEVQIKEVVPPKPRRVGRRPDVRQRSNRNKRPVGRTGRKPNKRR